MIIVRNSDEKRVVKRAGGITMKKLLQSIPPQKKIAFLCIGSPKTNGDAVAPLIAQHLRRELTKAFAIGSLHDPVIQSNLHERITFLKEKFGEIYVIAVDACLTDDPSLIGKICILPTPLQPGSGLGKELGDAGDASIRVFTSLKHDSHENSFKALHEVDEQFVGHLAWDIADYIINSVKQFVKP